MKRMKGAILLLSFLVGTLQPALPLIEYHIFKENIIQKFCVDRELPQSDCEGSCYLASQIEQNQERDGEPLALNLEFYPIAISAPPSGFADFTPESPNSFGPLNCPVCSLTFDPDFPPPRTV